MRTTSQKVTAPLAARILLQQHELTFDTTHELVTTMNSSVQRQRSEDLRSNDRLPLQCSGPGYQGTCSGQWNLGVRKVPPPGCLPCPLRNMGWHSIKEHSETSCACATTGSPPTYQTTVFVVIPSRLTMLHRWLPNHQT